MRARKAGRWLLVLLPWVCLTPTVAAARPKLLVIVAIDQMRADYVQQYGPGWKHGLRRLVDRGASFSNAAYPYLSTVTCPGHTTIATGAFPATHGMIANSWFDRQQGRSVPCTADPAAQLISYGAPLPQGLGHSLANLQAPTLADELKAQRPASRVVSFSMKPRSALPLGGRRPDLVAWFAGTTWATSTAVARAPSPVLSAIIASRPVESTFQDVWTKQAAAALYQFPDDGIGEHPPAGWRTQFPHPLNAVAPSPGTRTPTRYELWEHTPAADAYLGFLAERSLQALRLGHGPSVDLLAVSFSTLDKVGHAFGPRSHEIQEILSQLDVTIGRLLTALDRQVGKNRYVVAVTADHGVAELPEQLRARGQDAGRVSTPLLGEVLNRAIVKELGPGEHVTIVKYTDVYLAAGVYDRLQARPGALARVLATLPTVPGVLAGWGRQQLRSRDVADPLQRAAALSYVEGRSGDIVYAPKPHWIVEQHGTTHGAPHPYDQRVPLLLYGAGIRPGVYPRAVTPADVAPTLARLAGIKLPRAEGTPLREALR